MTIVTHHAADPAGVTLMKLEQELRIKHPHLAPDHARALIREAHPELVRLDHLGLPTAPEPTIDPGQLIAREVFARLSDGRAVTREVAQDQVAAEFPAWIQAWASCRQLPPSAAPASHAQAVPRQSSDPGLELMRLTQERMEADATLTVAAAQAAVLHADPELMAAYASGEQLPQPPPEPRPTVDRVPALLAQAHAASAELRQLQERIADAGRQPPDHLAGRAHYSDLPPAERERHLPRVRRLSPGDRLHPGDQIVDKMTDAEHGGGTFAIRPPDVA